MPAFPFGKWQSTHNFLLCAPMCDHASYWGPITWHRAQKSGASDLASSFGGPNIRKTSTTAPTMHARTIILIGVHVLLLFIVCAPFIAKLRILLFAAVFAGIDLSIFHPFEASSSSWIPPRVIDSYVIKNRNGRARLQFILRQLGRLHEKDPLLSATSSRRVRLCRFLVKF